MNKSNQLTKAVIYARFSSDMQRDESIDAQVRACREYAARNKIEIVGKYIDKAKSATSDQRPEFQRMIKDSADNKFNIIIVHKLDRFSRNRYDSAHYKHQLKRNGVALRSVVENLDGSPESVIMESVLEGMAEYYSLNLAREVEKGKRENALKGLHCGGVPPLGYDVIDKKLVVNEHEAGAVKLIFSMYLDGSSYGQIVKTLAERGYKNKVGKPFVTNSLHGILKNPKYTGVFTYSRSASKDVDGKRNGHAYKDDDDIIKVAGAVPALVSQDDFDRVQERMTKRKRNPARVRAKRDYLLSGKVFCGSCGGAYVGNARPARADHPEYLSYRCNNRTKRPRCSGWEIRKELLESIVLSELANAVFDDSLIPKLASGYSQYLMEQNQEGIAEQQAIRKKISDIQKQIDNIIAVITQTASNALVEKLNELDARKKHCERRRLEIQAQCKVKELTEEELLFSFKQAREMLKAGKLSTVKALIERYVKQVTISGENIEIQFNLNVGSRVHSYPATTSCLEQKKISQAHRQNAPVIFLSDQHFFMLAMRGGVRADKSELNFSDTSAIVMVFAPSL